MLTEFMVGRRKQLADAGTLFQNILIQNTKKFKDKYRYYIMYNNG